MSFAEPRIPATVVHVAALTLVALLLAAVGQPIFTDDVWWHLALGRDYAASGPWLSADPLLHTATGPPLPASWLADLAFFGVLQGGGFVGLRVLHVAVVASTLALVWSLFRRAGDDAVVASLGVAVFVLLAAYRLVQLRPELFTIAAVFAFYRLLIEAGGVPSRRRVAAAVGLFWLWANLHAGFLLGPILLAAAIAGLLVASLLRPPGLARTDRARALRLALALALGVAATGIHPAGFEAHLAYLAAGAETPALSNVADEWRRFEPFAWPLRGLPPSPAAFVSCWALLLAVPAISLRALSDWRRGEGRATDPALVAIALASLAALLLAVRFSWLALFAGLLVAEAWRKRAAARPGGALLRSWVAAAVALLLLPVFARMGDWPMISRGVVFGHGEYARPYPGEKYSAHAVWMLADAGLSGKLYNDYSNGGFLGYWLAPELTAMLNGSLNLPVATLADALAIAAGHGAGGESLAELLDRHEIDVFFGTGLPRGSGSARSRGHTTRHLEGVAGWLPIYRNTGSAVYLRANARNRENLERVAAYYAERGVPFDREAGLDLEAVIREAPAWAIAEAVLPIYWQEVEAATSSGDLTQKKLARRILGELYAVLGLYERALDVDRRQAAYTPEDMKLQRRLGWLAMRLGDREAALAAADELAAAPHDESAQSMARMLVDWAAQPGPEQARAFAAGVPLLTPNEARRFSGAFALPPARPPRTRD